MMGVGLMSIQTAMDLLVAGFSLMVGFGFFALVASVLCSVTFLHHVRAAATSSPDLFNFSPEITPKPESKSWCEDAKLQRLL